MLLSMPCLTGLTADKLHSKALLGRSLGTFQLHAYELTMLKHKVCRFRPSCPSESLCTVSCDAMQRLLDTDEAFASSMIRAVMGNVPLLLCLHSSQYDASDSFISVLQLLSRYILLAAAATRGT